MNTDYQIVAAGTISPLSTDTAASTHQSELRRYQETRDERIKNTDFHDRGGNHH